MYRILIFLFAISSSFHAESFDPKEFANLESKIDLVTEYAEKDQLHLISPHFISGLKQQQNIWVQKFASPDFSTQERQSSFSLYKKLNASLALLGESLLEINELEIDNLSGNSTGIIRGVVRSAITGTPLSQAYVYRYDQNGSYIGYKQTDSVGRYAFQNINDGTYYLSAQKGSQYNIQFYSGVSCPGGLGAGCQLNELIPIELVNGQIVDQINFELELNGIITGTLENATSGQNINGTVSVYNENFDFVSSYSSNYNSGIFSFYLPDNRNYYVTFSANGHVKEIYNNISCPLEVCDFAQATAISVTSNNTLSLGTIELETHHTMSGRTVRLPDLQPITTYVSRVEIVDTINNSIVETAYLDNDGYWTSDPLIPGNYYVRNNANDYLPQYYQNIDCPSNSYSSCNSSNFTTVTHGANQDTQNIDFRLRPGGVIKGTVFDKQANPTYAYVHIYNATGNNLNQSSSSNDGTFEFKGLSDGTYYISGNNSDHLNTLHSSILCSQQSNYSNSACDSATEGAPITISNYNTRTKNIHLKAGAKVSGIIRDSNNTPIAGANISLILSGNTYSAYDTSSDNNGNYLFSNVNPGNYLVKAEAYKHATVLHPNLICSAQTACNYGQGTVINVNGSNTYNNYNLNLPKLGNVKLTLKNTANEPVNSGSFRIFNSFGNNISNASPNSEGVVDMYLDPGTHYFSYNGNYYYQYISKVYGGNNCYDNCIATTGSSVTTNYGQVRNLSMTLDKTFRLTGSVLSDYDINNDWKYIKIYQNNNLISTKSIYSNNQFDLPLHLSGSVKVEAYQEGYYSQYFNGINCDGYNCGLSQATTINVTPNQTRNIDFNLNILNHIKGRVTTAGGAGVNNVQITFKNNQYSSRQTYTDNDGYYETFGLETGNYNILAKTNGQYESTLYGNIPCPSPCVFDPNQTVSISPGAFLNNRNIIMQERGKIEIANLQYVNGGIASNVDLDLINLSNNNQVVRVESDSQGHSGPTYLPQGSYKLQAKSGTYSSQLITAYPDIDCSLVGNETCINQSPTFTVNASSNISINDFKVNQRGLITAQVTAAENNSMVSGVLVQVYNSNYELIKEAQSQNGTATITNLMSGDYYAFAKSSTNDGYFSELYNEISCGRGIGLDCTLNQGNSFTVNNNSVKDITFTLANKPNLTVNLLNAFTQEPINGSVYIYSSTGNQISSFSNQSIINKPLFPGQYYVIASANNFNTIAYPDGICTNSYDFESCALGNAEVIVIDNNNSMINIELDLIGGVNGSITNAYTGEPIVGASVDFWTNSYYYNTSAYTNNQGRFSKSLNLNSNYWISTDVPISLGLYNQVYNKIRCFEGPAVLNLCDASLGTQIEYSGQNNSPIFIDFSLDGDPIFSDSFE